MSLTMSHADSTLAWPCEMPPLPPGGRVYTILHTLDTAMTPLVERWCETIADSAETHICPLTDLDPTTLRLHVHAIVAAQHVGWRLAVVADELTAIICRAEAIAAGLLDDEITVHATARTRLQMYCPHCRTLTVTTRAPGEIQACRGCQRNLRIRSHVSQTLGAYLASDTASHGKERSMAGAEDAPAQNERSMR